MEQQLRSSLSNDIVFNAINKRFITLHDDEVKKANEHLHKLVNVLISAMKEVDPLFAKSYREIIFGGSFYKGTRVGSPTEFDLVVVVKLPINYKQIEVLQGQPQCVKLYCRRMIISDDNVVINRKLSQLVQDDYLDKERFRQWMEGVLQRALNKLTPCDVIRVPDTDAIYHVSTRKSGPAFTLNVRSTHYEFDIDFVPALEFSSPIPSPGRASNLSEFTKKTWTAIAKPLGGISYASKKYRTSWIYSLYYQEKEILSKHGRVKPVIRQLKKLRDRQGWDNLPSYHIEMLVILELNNLQDVHSMPFTLLLFMMLKKLRDACLKYMLPYYWDTRCNLFSKLGNIQVYNIGGRLKRIICDIEKSISQNPYAIAWYMLTESEFDELERYIAKTPRAELETPGSYCHLL